VTATIPSSVPVARDTSLPVIRWARILITLPLAYFGWKGFHTRDPQAGVFWLVDGINLSVHEAGHMIFSPFGDTMHVIGGSLFECLLPAIFVSYFLRKQHKDVHAAMICLWWTSTAMLGTSIYMADARARKLMLITGGNGDESDGHDWYHLFAKWHVLRLDTTIARVVHDLAYLAFFVSIAVGLYAAWQSGRTTGNEERGQVSPAGE
jgi:hypothetical protein